MTKEKLAQLLSSKAGYAEQLEMIRANAKHHGLVVVYSLFDCIVIGGVINMYAVKDCVDIGPYEDMGFVLHKDGATPSWKSVLYNQFALEEARAGFRNLENAHLITLKWNDKCDYWRFETDLPHAKFTLKDFNGQPCGDGIVIDAKDLQ